jgi:hypothetical protein
MIHCTRLVGALLRIEISVVSRLRVVKVDPQDRGCAANRGRLKRSKYVVDPAPAVAGDVPDGLEIDDTAVRLNDGTFYVDDASEGRIGYWSKKDATRILGQTARSGTKENQEY